MLRGNNSSAHSTFVCVPSRLPCMSMLMLHALSPHPACCECCMPRGSLFRPLGHACVCACVLPEQDLAHTLRTRLAEQGRFVAPKRPQHAFAIEHYAGQVTYSSEQLLQKNKARASQPLPLYCAWPPPRMCLSPSRMAWRSIMPSLYLTPPCLCHADDSDLGCHGMHERS